MNDTIHVKTPEKNVTLTSISSDTENNATSTPVVKENIVTATKINLELDITSGTTSPTESGCTQVTHSQSQRNNETTLPSTNLATSCTDNNYTTNKTILDINNDRLSDNFVLSADEFYIDTDDETPDLNRTRNSYVDSVCSNPASEKRITNHNNFQNGLSEINKIVSFNNSLKSGIYDTTAKRTNEQGK